MHTPEWRPATRVIKHDGDEPMNEQMVIAEAGGQAAVPAQQERLGRIVAVSGGRAVIMLDRALAGEENVSPEIGTLLKVDRGELVALALVSSLSMPVPDAGEFNDDVRIVEVEFVGEIVRDENGRPKSFRRGVSQYPGLGDVVARANHEELKMAYAVDEDASISVGHIHQDNSIPAMVKLDEMLGKHFAILGTTGTGKSCSVALILRRILEKNPNAHILLLDMHREYARAFSDLAEVVRPEDLNLPFWLLNFEEICEILVGNHSHTETDTEVLRELIPLARARYRIGSSGKRLSSRVTQEAQNISVDVPLPYRVSDLMAVLEEHLGKLELKNNLAPYKRIKAKLESLSRDPRYAFMFGSLTVHDSMVDILSRLFRIPVNGRPITVLELGGLPSEVINVVVSVLARMAFDFALYSHGQVPITFVCEEAHRYVPNDAKAGFEPTRRAIARIAKEGRKYGVSLCIITQRPAELDPTILSQCNTVFSLRLTNERDQEILRAGISDSAASLLEFMPTMGVGEAVAFGEGISLPTRIRFDRLPEEHLPRSTTAAFSERWRVDIDDPDFLRKIVHRWREQDLNGDRSEQQAPQVATDPVAAQAMAHMPESVPMGGTMAAETTMMSPAEVMPGMPDAPHGPGEYGAQSPHAAGMETHAGNGMMPPSPADADATAPHHPAETPQAAMPQGMQAQVQPGMEEPVAPVADASMAGASQASRPANAAAEEARAALRSSLQDVLKRFRGE